MFITADDAEAVGTVHGELLGGTRPATSMVVVAGLLDPRWKVEIEAEAVVAASRLHAAPIGLCLGVAGTTVWG